jgi:peptidoglycan/LPS O-acetylase OafA/YrhL
MVAASSIDYRPDIDGLRAVAVLSVVVFHAFPEWISGGFIGVDIFFVISGYLISSIIFSRLNYEAFSFTDFYTRRINRIFPALIVVLISCLTLGWLTLNASEYKQLGKHVVAGAFLISNFVFWNESGYFGSDAITKPLLNLWSLGIEEQFYVIWPFILYFSYKNKFNLLGICIAVTAISFLINISTVEFDAIAGFYSPFTRFWELGAGSILAWSVLYKPKHLVILRSKQDIFLRNFYTTAICT